MGSSESKPNKKQQKIDKHLGELEKHDACLKDGVDTPKKTVFKDEESNLKFTGEASKFDPKKLREKFMRAHSMVDVVDSAALNVDPSTLEFPFENIVMEGGGNKGLAYVGSIKCLEDLGIMNKIKRIGGTSAGAITAALVALEYTAEEVLEFLSQDIESVFMDHSCGYFSLVPNLIRSFGWNPGNKIHEWFGVAIEKKMDDPDATFWDLYKKNGMELCVMVTNLNLMTAQYCHVKTTPNMPMRDALRMTMTIPGVFSAMYYDNHGVKDVYVDGGVLANYPVNCFDGWYLSMDKKDAFLSKLKSLKEFAKIMAPDNRFKATGPNKTIGFLLFADDEKEIMRFVLEGRVGALMPARPREDTHLWSAKEAKKREQEAPERAHVKIVSAVDNFLEVLSTNNGGDQEFISKDDLRGALESENFLPENKEILFGNDCSVDKVFDILNSDGDDKIAYFELIKFIEERGIRMQVRFQGYDRREIDDFGGFLKALQQTMLTNLKYTTVNVKDADRTVGINTGHLGTLDYDLEDADREFVVERGYNATLSFLRYYASKHPNEVKKREVPVTVQTQQPGSHHSTTSTTTNNNNNTTTYIDEDTSILDAVSEKDVLLEEKRKSK